MTPLGPTERGALLGIARGAILAHLGLAPERPLPEQGPLAEPRGAFVTVSVGGALRGCIGSFQPKDSLARTVAAMAVQAASADPRFLPVGADEIADLGIAVSALGPTWKLEDLAALQIGRHGIVVKKGWHRGTLLPRVAVEHGWNAPEFLKHACLKAGLPARAAEEPDTEVHVFEAEEFGEEPTA